MDNEKYKQDLEDIELIISNVKRNLKTLNPRDCADYAAQLSVYLSTLSDVCADTEVEYYNKIESIRISGLAKTETEAERIAKQSNEYRSKIRYDRKFEAVREIIQALKKRLPMHADEARGLY
jgi:hypothetical protein